MNKYIRKIIALMAILIIISPTFIPQGVSAAESATISVSSKSVSVGDEFSVTVSIDASSVISAAQIWITYDPSILQLTSKYSGGSGTATLISAGESSMTLTFKALAAGTSSLTISNVVASIGAEKLSATTNKSGSVTVSAPVSYSTDNTLSSLEISPGVLSPAFSSSVTQYTTSVDADCSQLVVNAVANDSNATVSISGRKLDPGTNTTTITVTAQDGSTKKYVITTTKAVSSDSTTTTQAATSQSSEESTTVAADADGETEAGLEVEENKVMATKIDGAEYTVSNDFAAHPLPTGYEVVDYEYEGKTISVGKGVNTKLILMYLENTDGNGASGFYVYDSVSQTFTPYREVSQPELTYVILPITDTMEKPDGFRQTTHIINGEEVDVLMDASSEYCLFYGVSSAGDTGWFRYDFSDNTIQKYSDQAVAVSSQTESDSDNLVGVIWKYLAIADGLLTVLLLAIVAVLVSKLSKSKKHLIHAIRGNTDAYNDSDDSDDLLNDDYEDDTDDALVTDDEKIFDTVSKALEKNLSMAQNKVPDTEDDELEILEVKDSEDK